MNESEIGGRKMNSDNMQEQISEITGDYDLTVNLLPKTRKIMIRSKEMFFTNEELRELAYSGNYKDRQVSQDFIIRNLAKEYLDERLHRSKSWISVEDRLPEGCNVGLNKLFIVAIGLPERTPFTYYAWFDGNEFYCSDFGGNINSYVTHWMPLPELTKE